MVFVLSWFCLQHRFTLFPRDNPNFCVWGSTPPLFCSLGQMEMTPLPSPGRPHHFPDQGGWFEMTTEPIKAKMIDYMRLLGQRLSFFPGGLELKAGASVATLEHEWRKC